MTKIYTRRGDKGETDLFSGKRVPKDSARVQAYGEVDELNSFIGLARAFIRHKDVDAVLEGIQEDLFVVGADLATPLQARAPAGVPRVEPSMTAKVEAIIDKYSGELSPLKAFILPGGCAGGALLHVARAVARRAERYVVSLSREEKINEHVVPYLNRLSDLLFTLARAVNSREQAYEKTWHAL